MKRIGQASPYASSATRCGGAGSALTQVWLGGSSTSIGNPYEIVGVMPRRFDFPLSGMTDGGVATDLWVPMSLTPKERQARGDNWSYNGIARMKAAVTVDQASADVNAVAQHIVRDVLPPDWRRELAFTAPVRPLAGQVSAGVRPLVQLLLGAVACVLLVACVNVANLLARRRSTGACCCLPSASPPRLRSSTERSRESWQRPDCAARH
jgi:putative ABC transport system permease protein